MPKSSNSNLYFGGVILHSLFSKVFQHSWVRSEADDEDVRRKASIWIGNYETIIKIKQRVDDFSINFYKLFISLGMQGCVMWVEVILMLNQCIRTFLLGNWKMVNFSIRFGVFFPFWKYFYDFSPLVFLFFVKVVSIRFSRWKVLIFNFSSALILMSSDLYTFPGFCSDCSFFKMEKWK